MTTISSPTSGVPKKSLFNRVFTKPLAKAVTGLAVATTAMPMVSTGAEKNYRTDVAIPNLRLPGQGALSSGYSWSPAAEIRKKVLEQDLQSITPQMEKIEKYKTDYFDTEKYLEYKELILFYALGQHKFHATALRSVNGEINNREAEGFQRQEHRDAIRTADEKLDLINKLVSGEIKLDQALQDKLKTDLDEAKATQGQKEEDFEKAVRRRRQWFDWVLHHGVLTQDQHKRTFADALKGVYTSRDALREANRVSRSLEGQQAIVTALLGAPEADRPDMMAKYQTDLGLEKGHAHAQLMAPEFAEGDEFKAELQRLIGLRNKVLQLRNQPWNQTVHKLDQWERDRLAREFEPTLTHLQQTKSYIETMQKKLADDPNTDFRLETDKSPNPWPKNFMIGVGVEQETVAWGQFYFSSLMGEVAKHKSLPAAMKEVARWGMSHTINTNAPTYQIPHVSTREVSGWNIEDKDKKRHVLILHGDDNPGDDGGMERVANSVRDKVRTTFNVPEGNVTMLKQPTEKAVAAAFDQLQKQGGKGTEVMVVLVGHGSVMGYDRGLQNPDRHKQGGYQGFFCSKFDEFNYNDIPITEDFMKAQTRKLEKFDSGVLLNLTCHAASWIAKNQPAVPPAGSRLNI